MSTSAKICVIEDDRAIAAMYQFKLEQAHYIVSVAYNGAEGLALIEKQKPDLILLDIKMPVMSGDEMLVKLRATDFGSTVKVIILTNISKDEAPPKLRFLNVNGYVVKAHYTPSQIVDMVESVLNHN
jgi:DNA-binding response OmpR family regulator